MRRRKATIYSIASNHSRAIEHELNALSASARQGDIRGMTYALSDRNNELEVGVTGSHADPDKAIGTLFRAAITLALVA